MCPHTTFQILRSLNRASWYTYVGKTNKMHTFLNNLFHLIYPWHVSSKQLFIIRNFVQTAYNISPCILKRSLVADTIWLRDNIRTMNQRCPRKWVSPIVTSSSDSLLNTYVQRLSCSKRSWSAIGTVVRDRTSISKNFSKF